jgi:hypothetical protein
VPFLTVSKNGNLPRDAASLEKIKGPSQWTQRSTVIHYCDSQQLVTDVRMSNSAVGLKKKSEKVLTAMALSANLNLKTEEGLPAWQPHELER